MILGEEGILVFRTFYIILSTLGGFLGRLREKRQAACLCHQDIPEDGVPCLELFEESRDVLLEHQVF